MTRSSPSLAVLVFLAMLGTQVMAAVAGIAAPVLATLAAPEIGVPAYLVGIFVSIMYAAAASAGLVSGTMIARWGAMRVSQACLVLCGAGLALATLGTIPALVAGALVLGAAYGPTTPASSHLLLKVTPPHRLNLVFSLKQTGVPLGYAIAGATLPSAALAYGWRAAVLGLAAICVLSAALLQPIRAVFDAEAQGRAARFATLARIFAPLALILRTPSLRLLGLTSFAYAGTQTCLGTFIVTYLVEALGMPVAAAGLTLSAGQAGGVIGRIAWGALADRLGRPATVLGGLGLGMTASTIGVALFTPAWPYLAMVAVCFAYGATAVAWNGVHLAQLARLAPPSRAAEVTGGTFFLTFGGVMVIPLLFSLTLGTTGSYALAYLGAGMMTAASGIAYLTRRL